VLLGENIGDLSCWLALFTRESSVTEFGNKLLLKSVALNKFATSSVIDERDTYARENIGTVISSIQLEFNPTSRATLIRRRLSQFLTAELESSLSVFYFVHGLVLSFVV
jgi:hypothetical protein